MTNFLALFAGDDPKRSAVPFSVVPDSNREVRMYEQKGRAHRTRRLFSLVAAALASVLALSACATDPAGDTISIGWMPWEEAIAVTNLWHVILEENGFEVDQQQLDPGIVFDGIAGGELDLFLDAWLPNTHSQYMEQYGDQLEDLGYWLADAPLTWTVPAYVDEVNSITDLAENADLFDGTIVGIEPGAGLTSISQNVVIPAYGLEGSFELIESSTPAMLQELEAAYNNGEPILVTLWRPHPAYARFDLKDLEDPENALGDPDRIHALARQGFSEDHPDIARALQNWRFEHEDLSQLTLQVLEEEGAELEGARAWLDANRDMVNSWLESTNLRV